MLRPPQLQAEDGDTRTCRGSGEAGLSLGTTAARVATTLHTSRTSQLPRVAEPRRDRQFSGTSAPCSAHTVAAASASGKACTCRDVSEETKATWDLDRIFPQVRSGPRTGQAYRNFVCSFSVCSAQEKGKKKPNPTNDWFHKGKSSPFPPPPRDRFWGGKKNVVVNTAVIRDCASSGLIPFCLDAVTWYLL